MPSTFEKHVFEMVREAYRDHGVYHAMATVIDHGRYAFIAIASDHDDSDAASRLRTELLARGASAYAVAYMAVRKEVVLGREGGVRMEPAPEAEGRKILDYVTPTTALPIFPRSLSGDPEEAIFVFAARRNGRPKAYALPLVPDSRELGEVQDLSGRMDSPFSDLFKRDPAAPPPGMRLN